MACQTFFFFFFFQEKQATENGILQIYKHGENGLNALRMAWLCEEPLCAPETGACPPFPVPLGFLPGAPPPRSVRAQAPGPRRSLPPPQRWPRWQAPEEPVLHRAAGSGSFSWATLSSL
ncbi:unnamed protein product [Rangifer tarandus platyrhynchus]|uniref:Uncharacterized protein n=1 Tax=Rangifer tarandus platyrhynchus TaxID=3082113 RepID=A0AC59Y1X0_RANTA